MSLNDIHLSMKKLIELGIVIPGRFSGTPGNITYMPISIEEYMKALENGDTQNLAYNTRTMGRGIFTIGSNGEILNYKGVDSKLKNEDSIAVSSTEGTIETINEQDSYGIKVNHFIDRNSIQGSEKIRLEFRIKGASQYQNLLVEKLKNDDIRKRDSHRLIKLPQIDYPTPLSAEMCERFDLPRIVNVTDDFMAKLDPNSYAGYCLARMKQNGIPFEKRNELWKEYFESHHNEKINDKSLMEVVQKEDSTYGLGAIFAQTTRVLENPFRIMEVQYFLSNNNIEALNAILDFSVQGNADFFRNYATISAKNAAGFINLKLAMNNFEHRQDYPLSGEICDDAYDDVSNNLYALNPSREDQFKKMQYYSQIFIFATNMKVLEDAFRLTGRAIPSDYKRLFVEKFYDSLEDKANFRLCFQNEDPMSTIKHFNNAEQNFRGMESFMQEIRQIAVDYFFEKNPQKNDSKNQNIVGREL